MRLKKVIHKINDQNQLTLIKGRRLLDSVVVVNEAVDGFRRKKQSGIIVKAHYEKTYYSVNWEFLYYMMERLDFNHK